MYALGLLVRELRGKASMQLSKNRNFFCKPKIFLKLSRIRKQMSCGLEESQTGCLRQYV